MESFEREYFEELTMSTFWYIYLRFKKIIYDRWSYNI